MGNGANGAAESPQTYVVAEAAAVRPLAAAG